MQTAAPDNPDEGEALAARAVARAHKLRPVLARHAALCGELAAGATPDAIGRALFDEHEAVFRECPRICHTIVFGTEAQRAAVREHVEAVDAGGGGQGQGEHVGAAMVRMHWRAFARECVGAPEAFERVVKACDPAPELLRLIRAEQLRATTEAWGAPESAAREEAARGMAEAPTDAVRAIYASAQAAAERAREERGVGAVS